uniref:Uncharacterized protein n=1 Tax=Hucho hucho TaxID=62062 RepID=A0A4W5R092_9TELE
MEEVFIPVRLLRRTPPCLVLPNLGRGTDTVSMGIAELTTLTMLENRCVERRRTTPHKMDTTATMLRYGSKTPTPEHLQSTPVKPSEWGAPPHADPWTPTANLRMLISAASPDIRDREMKKVLFRPIENERAVEDVEVDASCSSNSATSDPLSSV